MQGAVEKTECEKVVVPSVICWWEVGTVVNEDNGTKT